MGSSVHFAKKHCNFILSGCEVSFIDRNGAVEANAQKPRYGHIIKLNLSFVDLHGKISFVHSVSIMQPSQFAPKI